MHANAGSFDRAGLGQNVRRNMEPVPISLVTGFLGSGKTTLLNRLLRQPEFRNSLVLVNELGEIALDHLLIDFVDAATVVTSTGCICCAVPSDLAVALDDFLNRRAQGECRFGRILLETTGLADPIPVLTTLLQHPTLVGGLRLDGVIVTLDAVHAPFQLQRHVEARRQLAVADKIVVTKRDIATDEQVSRTLEVLRDYNPAAQIVSEEQPSASLFGSSLWNPVTKRLDAARWMSAEAYPQDQQTAARGVHSTGVASACLTLDRPVPWERFVQWVEMLRSEHTESLLRMKGVLQLEGLSRSVAVHGIHNVFYPPVSLGNMADRKSQVVLIVQGQDPGRLLNLLKESVLSQPLPTEPTEREHAERGRKGFGPGAPGREISHLGVNAIHDGAYKRRVTLSK